MTEQEKDLLLLLGLLMLTNAVASSEPGAEVTRAALRHALSPFRDEIKARAEIKQ